MTHTTQESITMNPAELPFNEIIEHQQGDRVVCRIMRDGWEVGTWAEAGWDGAGPIARKILAVNDLFECLDNTAAALETMLAHHTMPEGDRVSRQRVLDAARQFQLLQEESTMTKASLIRRLRAIERNVVQAQCDLAGGRAKRCLKQAHLQTLRTIAAARRSHQEKHQEKHHAGIEQDIRSCLLQVD